MEPRLAARDFLLGLLSDVASRSCWQLAEQAGTGPRTGLQSLLTEAHWDADGVRDDLRRLVVDELGDPDAVLIIDDTGDLKSGQHSVGVQRQYTGTAERIENAQVATFLGYASRWGGCSSTERSTCPARGPSTGSAAATRGYPTRSASPARSPRLGGCSPGH